MIIVLFCELFRLKGTTKGSKDMAKAFNALEMMDTLHEQGMRAFVVSYGGMKSSFFLKMITL